MRPLHNSIWAQIRAFFAGATPKTMRFRGPRLFGFFAHRLYLFAYGRFAKNQTGFEIIEFVQQSELCNGLIVFPWSIFLKRSYQVCIFKV